MTRHGKLHDNGMTWHGLDRHGMEMAWKCLKMAWKFQWHGMELLGKE
jgi:hypothetical protein